MLALIQDNQNYLADLGQSAISSKQETRQMKHLFHMSPSFYPFSGPRVNLGYSSFFQAG
jgi:hypothetical protein